MESRTATGGHHHGNGEEPPVVERRTYFAVHASPRSQSSASVCKRFSCRQIPTRPMVPGGQIPTRPIGLVRTFDRSNFNFGKLDRSIVMNS